jgi:hypothetical protein
LEALKPGRMQGHGGTEKYPDELRERAVKMLFEVREREGKGHGELARVARPALGQASTVGHGWPVKAR